MASTSTSHFILLLICVSTLSIIGISQFFCNKCCATCLCVPPGTYGNKDCCPCYRDWKTKEGKPKCP
ncbi:protein RSI-1 [Dorcoceras hygrometricum]|uniref:Protein RSI-1 n=1 Tax=Dorcoceras hygrometricum TaxID=472368 RepID=A0A2Z7A1L0_9LAMI|nr:protein RSI-1 [Dorcoceras hygrometricum]